jgi:hypothetical protein
MKDLLLDDMDIFIKDNLDGILAGDMDDKFSKDQLDKMLEISFLYNHLTFEKDSLTFECGDVKVRVNNLYEQYSDLVYQIGKEAVKNMVGLLANSGSLIITFPFTKYGSIALL